MHDLASSILGETDHQVRWLYHGDGDGDFNERTNDAKEYLSTLIFQGEIIGTTFAGLKYLNILTLNCDKVTELPSSIRMLIYLRHLIFQEHKLKFCQIGFVNSVACKSCMH